MDRPEPRAPVVPPLFDAVAAGELDPFAKACTLARTGCDAGTLVHAIGNDTLKAALVLAPEVPLAKATVIGPLCAVGFQNALGALAPPELAVHLDWDGGIRLNGASAGRFGIASDTDNPEAEPGWMVVGISLALWPQTENPGETPDRTALYGEGCMDVDPVTLLEAWARHTLNWINRWEEDGVAPLHREFEGLLHGKGEEVTILGQTGRLVGLDENLGLLLQADGKTDLIALTELLRRPV